MHKALDRFENNKDFIDWLKEHNASSEVISSILKINNDEKFDLIENNKNLLSAMLENKYDGEAIKYLLYDKQSDFLLKQEATTITLLNNKFDCFSIYLLCYAYELSESSLNFDGYVRDKKGTLDLLAKNGLTGDVLQADFIRLIDSKVNISNSKDLFECLVKMSRMYFCNQEDIDVILSGLLDNLYSDHVLNTIKNSKKRFSDIINTQPLIRKALETNQFMVSDLNLYHQDIPNFYKRFHFFTGTDEDIIKTLAIKKIKEAEIQDPSIKTVVKDAIAKVESERNDDVPSLVTLAAISLPESKAFINSSLEEAEVIRAEAASSRYNAL